MGLPEHVINNSYCANSNVSAQGNVSFGLSLASNGRISTRERLIAHLNRKACYWLDCRYDLQIVSIWQKYISEGVPEIMCFVQNWENWVGTEWIAYWSVHLITPSTTAPLLWNDLPVHTFFFPLPIPLLACLHTSQAPLHSLFNPNYLFKT